jgi:hypothetical protein
MMANRAAGVGSGGTDARLRGVNRGCALIARVGCVDAAPDVALCVSDG